MTFRVKKIISYTALTFGAVILGILCYVKFFLPDVEAAPQIAVPVTPDRVERGKYLAHSVAACMDCHSSRDWSRYSAPLVEGTLGKGGEYFGPEMGFPGKFYSKNLTPTHLGDWTDGEIYRAITTGVSKDGRALFPVMPYKSYGKMDREDIYDIIAYIRTLEPIENEIPPSDADFPMNFIINTIPHNAVAQDRPDPSNRVEYGAYLANAASCIDCHSPMEKGAVISELAFSGGREFQMPGGILRSANITPDKKTGIGRWNKDMFVARFKALEDPNKLAKVKEGHLNTIMPWSMYAGMKTSDLEAIYAYLVTLEPTENKVELFSAQ